jgi:hypothetical protein
MQRRGLTTGRFGGCTLHAGLPAERPVLARPPVQAIRVAAGFA